MIEDKNKGITVEYNLLNLPSKVSSANGDRIEWIYSADGTKLCQTVYTAGVFNKKSDYANGFIYETTTESSPLVLDYLSMSEGRVINNNGTFVYEYHVTDHLGNVRVAFINSGSTPSVVQENFYYPFGMRVPIIEGAEANKLLYNGKELVDANGLFWSDYGWRFYDAQLGRWHVVDPMAEKYPGWSPYNYVMNNPMRFIDPDGKWVYIASLKTLAKWAMPKENYPGIYYMNPQSYCATFIQNQLNDLAKVWNDPNDRHYAPRIAEYLKDQSIPIALVGGDLTERYGIGGFTLMKQHSIALSRDVLLSNNKHNGPDWPLLHEIVHMKYGMSEFKAYAAGFSSGYQSKSDILYQMDTDFDNFKKGMPTDIFKKYFENGKLIDSKASDFWKDYYNLGKTITGQNK